MEKTHNTRLILLALSATVLAACTTTPEQPVVDNTAAVAAKINDFPTIDRVEFVLQCIEKHGGLQYTTLYPCACKIDKIAALMTVDEYNQARTFTFLRRTPGEKGGVFRDPPHAKKLRNQLKQAEASAEAACFVKMP